MHVTVHVTISITKHKTTLTKKKKKPESDSADSINHMCFSCFDM